MKRRREKLANSAAKKAGDNQIENSDDEGDLDATFIEPERVNIGPQFRDTDSTEMEAYFGILIAMGAHKEMIPPDLKRQCHGGGICKYYRSAFL